MPSIDITFAIAAVVGGIIRLVNGAMRGDRLGWLMSFGHLLVSGFSGWVCGSAMMAISPDLALATAAISGYLGTQALDYLAELMKKKFSA